MFKSEHEFRTLNSEHLFRTFSEVSQRFAIVHFLVRELVSYSIVGKSSLSKSVNLLLLIQISFVSIPSAPVPTWCASSCGSRGDTSSRCPDRQATRKKMHHGTGMPCLLKHRIGVWHGIIMAVVIRMAIYAVIHIASWRSHSFHGVEDM